jgi:chemotaxis protein MotB
MDRNGAKNVTIIKRKKVVAGGHHGGAWKVAYADFVTAMMAFFLLMWLLSVSDEEMRMGLADYFSPTIPIHSTRGGGDGPFEGSSMFSQDTLANDETGAQGDPEDKSTIGSPDKSLYDIQKQLSGGSGDVVEADPLLRHIATRVTDEGLIIDVFDIDGSPLFRGTTSQPNPIHEQLVGMIGRVLAHTTNKIAVSGHLAEGDVMAIAPNPWELSSNRAQIARAVLVRQGVADARLDRIAGKADRSPVTGNPRDDRNRRIEIILLREFPK